MSAGIAFILFALVIVLWRVWAASQKPFVLRQWVDTPCGGWNKPTRYPTIEPGMSVAERCRIEDWHYRNKHGFIPP